MQTYNSAE